LQLSLLFWAIAIAACHYARYPGGLQAAITITPAISGGSQAAFAVTPAILAACNRCLQLHPQFWRLAIVACSYTRYTKPCNRGSVLELIPANQN
jgi:hypothetical protein